MDKTISFSVEEVREEYILETLKDVKNILLEKGYNPINQIVGYLITGDPGYITSYKNARGLIMTLDRCKALEVVVQKAIL